MFVDYKMFKKYKVNRKMAYRMNVWKLDQNCPAVNC